MDANFLGTVKNFFALAGADVIFFVAAGLIAASFSALYIPYRLQKSSSRKYPRAFLLLTAVFLLAETAALAESGFLAVCLPLTAAIGVFFYLPFAFFPAGKIKAKKAEKKLIDLIDSQIKNSGKKDFQAGTPGLNDFIKYAGSRDGSNLSDSNVCNAEETPIRETRGVQKINCRQEKKEQPCEIDFNHVKNIIERLQYYNLNTGEKRQVKDLQYAVARAENDESLPEDASTINDGLGAVLKIMAKYGV